MALRSLRDDARLRGILTQAAPAILRYAVLVPEADGHSPVLQPACRFHAC